MQVFTLSIFKNTRGCFRSFRNCSIVGIYNLPMKMKVLDNVTPMKINNQNNEENGTRINFDIVPLEYSPSSNLFTNHTNKVCTSV